MMWKMWKREGNRETPPDCPPVVEKYEGKKLRINKEAV